MPDRRGFLKLTGVTLAATTVGAPIAAHAGSAKNTLLYVGSYAKTITTLDGDLKPVASTTGLAAPSYLTFGPGRKFLYAVDEQPTGTISAFAVGAKGELTLLNTQPTGGNGPAQTIVDPTGKYVLTADYGSGSVSVLPIAKDGRIGARTDLVQHKGSAPHAHMVRFAPDGAFALVADLGTDEVHAYRLGAGKLTPTAVTKTPPGTGPRHFRFGPGGRVYLVGESDSTLRTYSYDRKSGALKELHVQPTTVDKYEVRNYPSEIALSPDNRFCYVGNRGANVVTTFDLRTPTPKPIADTSVHGNWPRHFAVTRDRIWVANQKSDNLAVLTRNPSTGVPAFSRELALTSPSFVLPA